MDWNRIPGTACSACDESCLRRNECELLALADEDAAPQEQVVTYRIPAQPGAWMRALAWAVGSFAGTSAALALWKLVGGW